MLGRLLGEALGRRVAPLQLGSHLLDETLRGAGDQRCLSRAAWRA
ncbi:hypothetical protein ACFZAE_26210 [Streptomyces scabiei]|nr:hypothetical protein [Streptomyces sp. AC495_CC817]